MSEQHLSQEELDALARLVTESLAKGENIADVSAQLVNNGWEQGAADEFVGQIALHRASAPRRVAPSKDGGGGMGWLIWIGVIILINVLSQVFNWGFWIY
ncbi:MAG: hypothetical protein ABI614_23465 [Planctomycetota bacterium]